MFSSLTAKLIISLIGFVVVFGSITTTYIVWKKGIERTALLEANQKQLEQSIRDKEELSRKLKILEDAERELIKKLKADEDVFLKKIGPLDDYLNDPERHKEDRPSSQILKNTKVYSPQFSTKAVRNQQLIQ